MSTAPLSADAPPPEKHLSKKLRLPLDEVLPWAQVLQKRLVSACEKVVLAGSLRREKAQVADVEIVLLPKFAQTLDRTLFGDGEAGDRWEYPLLTALLERYVAEGWLAWDESVRRNGPRYKRLRAVPLMGPELGLGLPVDLFIADRHNFGNTLAIRTGCAEFSKALVTRRQYGGLMPGHLRQENGYLWNGAKALECPTEGFFFEMLGLPVVPPMERTAEMGTRLAKERLGRAKDRGRQV